jgi:quinol monooxygenase YgiN
MVMPADAGIGPRHEEADMVDFNTLQDGFVVTAFWEVRAGEEDAVANILSRFAPHARQEPDVLCFIIHRSRSEPAKFFFYEVFRDEAAFAAHQQTAHFKELIAGAALGKLARRERAQYAILQ